MHSPRSGCVGGCCQTVPPAPNPPPCPCPCLPSSAPPARSVMPEALEKWPVRVLAKLLPRHMQLIEQINTNWLASITDHVTTKAEAALAASKAEKAAAAKAAAAEKAAAAGEEAKEAEPAEEAEVSAEGSPWTAQRRTGQGRALDCPLLGYPLISTACPPQLLTCLPACLPACPPACPPACLPACCCRSPWRLLSRRASSPSASSRRTSGTRERCEPASQPHPASAPAAAGFLCHVFVTPLPSTAACVAWTPPCPPACLFSSPSCCCCGGCGCCQPSPPQPDPPMHPPTTLRAGWSTWPTWLWWAPLRSTAWRPSTRKSSRLTSSP